MAAFDGPEKGWSLSARHVRLRGNRAPPGEGEARGWNRDGFV